MNHIHGCVSRCSCVCLQSTLMSLISNPKPRFKLGLPPDHHPAASPLITFLNSPLSLINLSKKFAASISTLLLLSPPLRISGTKSCKSSKPRLIRFRRFCSDKMWLLRFCSSLRFSRASLEAAALALEAGAVLRRAVLEQLGVVGVHEGRVRVCVGVCIIIERGVYRAISCRKLRADGRGLI